MSESVQIERPAKLAVDSDQQVLVERGGDAKRVVVGQLKLPLILDEVGAEQQQITRLQDVTNSSQKGQRRRRVEVADVRTEEEHQHGAVPLTRRGRPSQADLVGGLVTDDGDVLETSEPLLGLLESLRGDINNVYARGASGPLQRLREHRELFPAAAAKLDDRRRLGIECGDDFSGVRDEQPMLRPSDAVPRQPANRLPILSADRPL